jgi:hypothetical protein
MTGKRGASDEEEGKRREQGGNDLPCKHILGNRALV